MAVTYEARELPGFEGIPVVEAQEEVAKVRDVAFELLEIVSAVSRYDVAMDEVFSSELRSRIRRVIAEAS